MPRLLPVRWMARLCVAALMLVLAAAPGWTQESSPKAPVEALSNTLLDVMRKSQDLGFEGRYRALQPVVEASFDLPLMARFSLGSAWAKLDDAQRKQLVAAFERYSLAQYAASFSGYSGERFEIGEATPRGSGDMLVHSKLVPPKGEPTELDYLVRQEDGRWRIIDVYLEGSISQLAIRRSELGAVYRRSGFDGLIAALHARAQQIAKP